MPPRLPPLADCVAPEARLGAYVPWIEPLPLALSELRAAVELRVRALRDAGLPPEQVVIAVKALARELPQRRDSVELGMLRTQELRSWMVRWAIDEYYAG